MARKKKQEDQETVNSDISLAQASQALDKLCADLTASGTVLAGRPTVVPEVKERLTIKFDETPIPELNELLGGGLPIGRIVLIAGLKDTGKTHFMLSFIGHQMNINPNYRTLWIESEESLDVKKAAKLHKLDLNRFWAASVTVTKNKKKEPGKNKKEFGAEAVGNAIESAIRSSSPNIVVINSLKLLVPMSELEQGMEKDTVGRQAAFNSKLMKRLTTLCAEHNTTLVLIQHYTTEIGTTAAIYGNPLRIAGGEAIRHANMLTMEFSTLSLGDGDPIEYGQGLKIKIRVTKNHCVYDRPPHGSIIYYIEFGKGIEKIISTLYQLIERGIITKAGAWLYLLDENGEKQPDYSWNGKAKFKADMENNPDKFNKLYKMVQSKDLIQYTEEENDNSSEIKLDEIMENGEE